MWALPYYLLHKITYVFVVSIRFARPQHRTILDVSTVVTVTNALIACDDNARCVYCLIEFVYLTLQWCYIFRYVHAASLTCESYRRYQLAVGRCCIQCGNNTHFACPICCTLKCWCIRLRPAWQRPACTRFHACAGDWSFCVLRDSDRLVTLWRHWERAICFCWRIVP